MFKIVIQLIIFASLISLSVYFLSYKLWFGVGKKVSKVTKDIKKEANREE